MFKGLRDRLKGVSEKLEDELEAKLEAELEAELAAEMDRELGIAPATATEPTPEPTPEPVSEPTPAPVPEPAAAPTPAPETTPAPAPTATPEPSSAPSTPAAPATPTPAFEAPKPETFRTPEPVPATDRQPEPARTPEPAPAPAPAPAPTPAPVSTPAPEPAPVSTPVSAPAQTSPQPQQPARQPQQQPITGRKMLTAEEIEARLKAELEAAVEVQKDVEQVAKESGATLRKYTISESALEDILWELEIGLLESDVALPVIEAIKENVKEQMLSMSVSGKSAQDVVEKVLRAAVRRVLNVGRIDFDAFVREKLASGKKPVVVMFVGVNGTGKTTSIARIAHRLKSQGLIPVLAAGDTFRAGAIAQLTQHADTLGVKVIKHSDGADPAAVAYDAIEHAKARHKDVVLLDTAGRMQTNTNLMDEMDKIRRVANPDMVVFVGDSLAGNDAVEQARRFDQVVDIDGAILTKVDVDAKGGAALSVAYTVNKPLLFVGVGQGYEDLIPFDPSWMVDRLFGDEDSTPAAS